MKADIHFVASVWCQEFSWQFKFLSFYFHDTSECHIGLKLLQFNCHFMGKTAVTMLQCNTARLNLERGQHLKKRGVYFWRGCSHQRLSVHAWNKPCNVVGSTFKLCLTFCSVWLKPVLDQWVNKTSNTIIIHSHLFISYLRHGLWFSFMARVIKSDYFRFLRNPRSKLPLAISHDLLKSLKN